MASSRSQKQYSEGPGGSRAQGKYSTEQTCDALKCFVSLQLPDVGEGALQIRVFQEPCPRQSQRAVQPSFTVIMVLYWKRRNLWPWWYSTSNRTVQALVWKIIETGSLERLPSNQAIILSLRLGFLHVVVNSLANNSILFGWLVDYFYFCTEVVTWNWCSKSLSHRWTVHFCAGIETLSFAVNLRTDTRWKQISEMYINFCSFLPFRLEKMTAWQVSRIPIFRRLLPGSE